MLINTNECKEHSPTLLIVDDEEIQEILLKAPLKRNFINCIFTRSGQECIEILSKPNNIVLVLLDLLMPKMDGFTTIEKIRKLNRELPVIAVSASASSKDIEFARGYGFNDILLKPININEICKQFELYSNQKTINEIQTSQNPNENYHLKYFIEHMEQSREDLEVSLIKNDIEKMKGSLHKLRENNLCTKVSFISLQIEAFQSDLLNGTLKKAKILDFLDFLKNFLERPCNKICVTAYH
ncbi:response regulator [Thalassotalea piscium]|uniref:CheY-like chemotaxis protein n=1 Tax=Thalassotalea piscium TaxID=1230533 RepID=A0A7X0TTA2_9GAMM|nr:response regulator [Thalassotalea piscium]MBB6543032.1 CheY-like chemotaxis protein [Thalassotalea piscium]